MTHKSWVGSFSMVTILDISLDPTVRDQLRAVLASGDASIQIHHSETTEEALDHIRTHDIDIIMVNVRVLPKLRKEINELLANTPLTTKIILLESPEEIVDLEPFSHLGLETISLPLSLQKLQKLIG